MIFEYDFSWILEKSIYAHVLYLDIDRILSNMHVFQTSSCNFTAYLREVLPRYKSIPFEEGSKYPTADAITKSQCGLTAVSDYALMSHTGNHAMYNACLWNIINFLNEMAFCVERCVVHFRIIHRSHQKLNLFPRQFFQHVSVSLYFIAYIRN